MSHEIISIKSNVGLYDEIIDRRMVTHGMSFGTIEKLVVQYGIHVEPDGDALVFTAPKDRLRMFAEKLHFADISFFGVEE